MERQQREYLTSESPVFANKVRVTNQKPRPLTHNNINSMMFRILKKTGIERIKVGNRFDKALFYGLRKRFNGILKMNNDVNSNIAEKLMAHRNGFDGVYLKPTREQCFAEFSKAIQDLTISSENKNKMMIKKQEETITELNDEKDKVIAKLTAQAEETKAQVAGLWELLGKKD
jgi:integrase/recombinase XerD